MEGPSTQSPRKPKKRAKTGHATAGSTSSPSTSKDEGALRPLLHLPLELSAMILSELSPLELLTVYRCKLPSIVATLESEHGKYIWRACFENIPDLPRCPKQMKPWEYAALMFENKCTTCSTRKMNVDWYYLRKVCTKCRKNLTPEDKIPNWEYDDTVPFRNWLEAYVNKQAEERETVLENRKQAIMQWIATTELQDELETFTSTEKKLIDKLKVVKEPKKISDEDWPKIKKSVRNIFGQVKLAKKYDQVVLELSGIYFDYVLTDPHPDLSPDFTDFCFFPDVANAIHDRATSAGDYHWDPDTISHVQQEIIPDAIETWRSQTFDALLAKIPEDIKATELMSGPDAILALATTWFKRRDVLKDYESWDEPVQTFPQILRQRPFCNRQLGLDRVREPKDYLHNALRSWPHATPWLAAEKDIVYSYEAAEAACEIVSASGLDPHTAFLVDMDRLDYRYWCTCDIRVQIKTWRRMVVHRYNYHPKGCGGTLIILNEHDTAAVRRLEDELQRTRAEARPYPSSCRFCHGFKPNGARTFGSLDLLREHILECHMAPSERDDDAAFKGALAAWDVAGKAVRCIMKNRKNARFPFSTPGLKGYYAVID